MEKLKENKRTIIYFIIFIVFLLIGIIVLMKSFSIDEDITINYKEKSNIDYRVQLKENDFYESEYLGKDMIYVASLIDKINIDFDYLFTIDEKVDMDLKYTILGTLLITDMTGEKKYYEKEYQLLEEKSINIKEKTSQEIKETINIDYDYYNKIVNEFRRNYGLSTQDKFIIHMKIDKYNNEDKSQAIEGNYMTFSIPLSEKSVNISMDYKELEERSHSISKKNKELLNKIYLVISAISIVISIVMLVISIYSYIKNPHKNKYEIYVNKILKEYDRLIVETSNLPNTQGTDIIRIEKFSELVDVHDNIKMPIMYYIVREKEECCFYIKHEDTIYLKEVKSKDFINE